MKYAPTQYQYTEQQMRALTDGATMIFDTITEAATECRCHVCIIGNAITTLAVNYTDFGTVPLDDVINGLFCGVLQTVQSSTTLTEDHKRGVLAAIAEQLMTQAVQS